jgi:O-antigen ligase
VDASIRMRTQLLIGGSKMFLDHPILGVGVGNFIVHSVHYSGVLPPSYAHNMFLHVAAETGVLGIFFFVALLWMTWRMLRRIQAAASQTGNLFYSHISQSLEISLIGFCVAAFFLSQHFNKMLWILIALTGSFYNIYISREESFRQSDDRSLR